MGVVISTAKMIVVNRDTRTFHSNTLLRPILITCTLLILVIAAAGVAAAAMPPVPYFSQCDSRWGSDKLGGDGPTIWGAGCALTSAAMVMAYYGVNTDPQRLNNVIGRFGSADQSVAFGEPDDLPIIGDWDGDEDDNIGLYRSGDATGLFYLDIDNDGRGADIVMPEYGDLGDVPIAGDGDRDSDDNIEVYRPGTGEFFMDATVPEVSSSKTIYVDDDFSDDPSEHRWDTIQEGVDDADDGDTVVVYAGEYVENVNVCKRISLIGDGADVVTVQAALTGDRVFDVTTDYVNIGGFTVTGATGYGAAGIYLNHTNHCTTYGNNASNNTYGICLEDSSNNTLTSNVASNNTHDGIAIMHYSNYNTLESNTVSDNSVGIVLSDSSNNTLENNTALNNNYNNLYCSHNNTLTNNIFINDGLCVEESSRNTVENNTVNGKPLIYFEDASDFVVQNAAGQVILVNCTNVIVENLKISNTSVGVELVATDDCKITNNIVSNSGVGIDLIDGSSNNTLTNNTANSNDYYGILLLDSSNNNTLTCNTVSNNDYGIRISRCYSSNTLYHNNLLNNTFNTYDTGTNTWDSGSVGNYYSDYIGNDSDGDGIGDTPHPIPGGGGSVDNYPLMQPWTQIDATTPNFCLEDAISGKTICLSNYSNKVVLLDFMTIWCPWCQKEADDILVPLYNQYYANDSKVVFLSIDIGDSTTQQLQAYAEQHNINFSILMCGRTSGVAEDYGIRGVPTTVVVLCKGTERTVYNTYAGYYTDSPNVLREWIEEAKKSIPTGDLDHDGILTPADAAIALAIAASGSASCNAATLDAADVSGDGRVTSLDALMILQAPVDSTTQKENRSAVIETSMGTMTAEFYGQRAPNTTANFIELAESGFYDGLIFHRVIDDFVIQGGCPNGDGIGGSGKTIELEIHPDLTHADGAIAMARSQDPDSASSQFYICDGAQHRLDGNYAVFGKVIDGMDVVRAIAEVATDSRDKPIEDVVIIKISIIDCE